MALPQITAQEPVRTVYRIWTVKPDQVVVHAWTNDNLDEGRPSETASWDITFASLEKALSHTGGTRTEPDGQAVTVYLDEVQISQEQAVQLKEAQQSQPAEQSSSTYLN